MKKALIDTNIILDNMAKREPFSDDANAIFSLITQDQMAGFTTASSITDIHFLLSKAIGSEPSINAIENLLDILEVISVTKDDCLKALKFGIKDFEDALVAVCADKEDLDFIVTRDVEFLKQPKAITPSEFLSRINEILFDH